MSLSVSRRAAFTAVRGGHPTIVDANEEKKARAALLGAVERALTRDTVVIVDSLNYIKGYRYQLYCLARALSTPHLVVYCLASEKQVHEWNHHYDPTVLAQLVSRYEEPNNRAKWDSPLIAVGPDDTLPIDDMRAIIEGDAKRPPSLATQGSVSSSSCATNMDRVLQDICELLVRAIRAGDQTCLVDGKTIPVSGMTPTKLQRIRKHFAYMNRLNPVDDCEGLRRLFIDYLSSAALHDL